MPDTARLASPSPRYAPLTPTPVELLGHSPAALRLQELIRRAASADTSLLIVGDPGTDAASVAHEVHRRSRPTAPFVIVECSGDAPWFDHVVFGAVEPGAPTDLESVSSGSRLAAAVGGTLLLRDVTELPAFAQARLARIARDREFRIDGEPVAARMRIIATSTTSIDEEVRENRFRGDLYRRLAALRVDLPPLRERPEDVAEMAEQLLGQDSAHRGAPRAFTQAALALLGALNWPGNVLELKAIVERAVARCGEGDMIQVEHVLPALNLDRSQPLFAPSGNLREARLRFEREYIAAVLQHHGWRMAEAAHTLGIQRPNLYRKARQLGIPVARLSE